jgi:signal transduction histidine kinase
MLVWFLPGFVLGLSVAGFAAWWYLRRHLRKVREAERRARAAERMAEIGAMTGGLAHEIKNPLSTIGLNAQLLSEGIDELAIDPESKGRLLRRLGSLRREVERLRGVLSDFLSYAGNIKLDARPVDLNQIVEELTDFFGPQAQQAGVRLRASPSPTPVTAHADASLVKQAVLNLMLNAVQAMSAQPDGRERELFLRTELHTEKGGQTHAVLHVTDTGPGMSAETLSKIFTPYFTTKAGGSGLGLPTARRLIEAHPGRLEVHSEPGRGTDFRIVLPTVAPGG